MRLRQIWRRLWQTDGDYVSEATVRHHLAHEYTRGVDLPTWRHPKEVARMRRAEAREMRIVQGQRRRA